MHTNEIEQCGCVRLDIDPARIAITTDAADGTRITIRDVPCGVCAGCGAPIFRRSVSDAVRSIRTLLAVPGLGHVERSYSEIVQRYWAH